MPYPWGPVPFGGQPTPPPPAPNVAASPGVETEFWRNALNPSFLRPDFPKIGRMGLGMTGLPAVGETVEDLMAAYKVLSGQEDPMTTPAPKPAAPPAPRPAGKPQPAKINPIPATAAGGTDVLQPSGPAEDDIEGAVNLNGLLPPVPEDPPKSPSTVSVTLPDGRSFDYAQGESIPRNLQGTFGPMSEDVGYTSKAGFIKTGTKEAGGTGRAGGFATAVTPASRLQRATEESAIAKASEPFPQLREIEARATADAQVRAAQAKANDAFEQDRLGQRIKDEQDAQNLITRFQQQKANGARIVEAAEAKAKASGREEDITQAAKLREDYEQQTVDKESELDKRLAAKGIKGVYKPQ